jgi:hypothetical protein
MCSVTPTAYARAYSLLPSTSYTQKANLGASRKIADILREGGARAERSMRVEGLNLLPTAIAWQDSSLASLRNLGRRYFGTINLNAKMGRGALLCSIPMPRPNGYCVE